VQGTERLGVLAEGEVLGEDLVEVGL